MTLFLRRTFPLILTFLFGVAAALQYYIPHPVSEAALTEVSVWLRIILGFAMILGIASLCHVHYAKIRIRAAGWGYSLVVYLSMLATVAVGLWSSGQEEGTGFGWIYTYALLALQGTMFSMLGFFVASAAFRAFRARSKEAAVLLVAAVIMMFGRVPLGEYLIPAAGPLAGWILNVLNTAARRGIIIGISLGGIATSIKIIFGIERSYLGSRD
ncbi:hypothetical protein [Candidatus Methylomirabilis sp.]|uniref:Uncharacterized protein n=1 Tax=Candidatus Methylomirabilis tolerans TaxID=3123416 RepID=A0AAJ1AFN6_9BACT|nr:hypothetical protein [Candidatus Methylomirabilis sp.]